MTEESIGDGGGRVENTEDRIRQRWRIIVWAGPAQDH